MISSRPGVCPPGCAGGGPGQSRDTGGLPRAARLPGDQGRESVRAKWRCAACGGVVDHQAAVWYTRGLAHAAKAVETAPADHIRSRWCSWSTPLGATE